MKEHATDEVVAAYYDLLRSAPSFDRERLSALVADDLDFEGPIAGRRVGAEAFLEGVSRFAGALRSIELRYVVCSGSQAATLYDAAMYGGAVRFAEFFDIARGRIERLRLLYDPAQYRAAGGR